MVAGHPLVPQPRAAAALGGVGEEQPWTGGPHTAGGRLREAVLESLGSLGRAGALCPSVVLGPGSARRPRWPCHGGGWTLCKAGRAPAGQPRPCPPPALASSSSSWVASATTSGLWLQHVASLGSPLAWTPRAGVSCLASGLLEAGARAPAKVGLTPRAPASVQNWGPSALGELLFRPRTVEDSPSCWESLCPGPAACGTPTSPHLPP